MSEAGQTAAALARSVTLVQTWLHWFVRCRKEARKAKLKAAAAKMKQSQTTEAAFADSKYSLPEESTTPNMRTLAVRVALCGCYWLQLACTCLPERRCCGGQG